MNFRHCKDCQYENSELCVVRQSIKDAILTPDSGCTEEKDKKEVGEAEKEDELA